MRAVTFWDEGVLTQGYKYRFWMGGGTYFVLFAICQPNFAQIQFFSIAKMIGFSKTLKVFKIEKNLLSIAKKTFSFCSPFT